MNNLDQEVGFIRGQQVAMEKQLSEIKSDVKAVNSDVKEVNTRLNMQDKVLATIVGKIDDLIVAQKTTDKHPAQQPIKVTTQIETDGQSQTSSVVTRVLRWQSLPWVIALILIMVMVIVCFSVLTGRNVSTFLPTKNAAP